MFPVSPFQIGYWGTRYLINKYVRSRVSKRVQGAALLGTSAYLLNKKKPVKMMTPTTAPRKRSREGSVAVLPDMGTYTNNPVTVANDYGGYTQRTREKVVVGRSLSAAVRASKILSSDIVSAIDRFQYLSEQANDSVSVRTGRYYLSNTITGATPTRTRKLPVYLFDLTCLRENHGYARGGNNIRYGTPFYRLRHDEQNSVGYVQPFVWENVLGVTPDWSTSTYPANVVLQSTARWSYESLPYKTVDRDAPYTKAYLDWSHVKMELFGAAEFPTEVTVSLVRLDERVQPPMLEYDSGGLAVSRVNTDNEEIALHSKFWDKFTAPRIGTDLVSSGNAVRVSDHLKTIWSRRYRFNPTMTTESDASGHQRRVELFYNMDMVVDYSRDDINNETGADSTINTNKMFTTDVNWWDRNFDAANGSCYPKNADSRVFLMIAASGIPSNTSTTESANLFPSFDLMVRRKISLVAK